MNVSFTEKQEKYIAAQISSGDYQNLEDIFDYTLKEFGIDQAIAYVNGFETIVRSVS